MRNLKMSVSHKELAACARRLRVPTRVRGVSSVALAVWLLMFSGGGFSFAQDHGGHTTHGTGTAAPKSSVPAPAPKKQETAPTVTISPDRLQLIGVRTAVASYRSLDRAIRTVGKVEPDETKLAFVNTKVGGWVKKLFVSFTGEQCHEGPAAACRCIVLTW